MPLLETKGAASAQGFGEFAKVGAVNYIEDVFSTYLYTGTGASQTITNGIDLSAKGGLIWCKARNAAVSHGLTDTARGNTKVLRSNTADWDITTSLAITSFNNDGFSLGTDADTNFFNGNGNNYVSWTFRKQEKFFDVLTYTGNGSNRTIAHNLGSVPGCILIKRASSPVSENWQVYHRSLANTEYLVLNSNAAKATGTTRWNSTTPTSTEFSLGTDSSVNTSGATYVAYLFAHDAGGFGLTGNDNVISCGSVTVPASGDIEVNLGYEPQWILFKASNTTYNWFMFDTMRGMSVSSENQYLFANLTNTEASTSTYFAIKPTATGFVAQSSYWGNNTFIYIAIRRGPMKVPTDATKVYSTVVTSGTGTTSQTINPGFTQDSVILRVNITLGSSTSYEHRWYSRLRGNGGRLRTAATAAQATQPDWNSFTRNMSFVVSPNGNDGEDNAVGTNNNVNHFLRRAPGFFDEVCWTSTGTDTVTHNLKTVPELIIRKRRDSTSSWNVYSATLGADKYLILDQTAPQDTSTTNWQNTTPTASVFYSGNTISTGTYVAYLFATCPGVSKVGSYTGTGNTLQIDCGFTGGAKFVLIKRTDSTGDWYYWDSARGIVAGNDPYLRLNDDIQQITNTDWVDTHNPGFELSNAAGNNVNINTATYLFLAIA